MAGSAALAVELAEELTGSFLEREPRYLWTDAFAVCNCLALARASDDARWLTRALELVERVHRALGRHRPDDPRTGWLSGLPEREGDAHPTRGGLRIGKPLPERRRDEPLDERLEWERDGQYFHYLTQWMHALHQVASAAREPRFDEWARELAAVAHGAFLVRPPGAPPRMVWKMSVDLQRALVPSMGQHDPLDGYVICLELGGVELAAARADFAAMLARCELRTADPLGLGVLLADAHRLAQLAERGVRDGERWLPPLVAAAAAGLQQQERLGEIRLPASRRLAFRELGLAIGLAATRRSARLAALDRYAPLGDALVAFWREGAHRANTTWAEHRDINEVMLATALVPDGYLEL